MNKLLFGQEKLQPFYDAPKDGGGGDPNPNPDPPNPNPNPDPEPPAGGEEKKFSQEQLNSILAADKRKTQAALYKELGFENEDAAKEFIEKYKEQEDKNKTELEKATANNTALKTELDAEKAKAQQLENKFKAIELGCNPESADDVVILASAKVDDGKDFATALNEVKESYPSMFTSNGGSTGKGGTPPRGKTGGVAGDFGKRLAEEKAAKTPEKNEFFSS